MEKFDDVWIFIEHKLKTSIPTYMKNILKVCGYDNGILISSIVEEDIIYFESEVRNGNVSRYFNKNKDVLEGSTKSKDNFEFSRGHKRFLISIVDFMRNHLKENGQDVFVPDVATRKLVTCPRKQPAEKVEFDRWKSQRVIKANTQIRLRNHLFQLSNRNQAELQNFDLKIHTGILISKIIMSLIDIVPEMYAENMESINKKILFDLIEIKKSGNNTVVECVDEFNEDMELVAIVKCPFCLKLITDFSNTKESTYSWSISNFEEHLNNTHFSQIDDLHHESFALGATSSTMKMSLRPIIEETSSSISDISPIDQKRIVCHKNLDENSYSTPPIVECFDGENQTCCDTSKFESYNVHEQSNSIENSHISVEPTTVLLESRITNTFQRKSPAKEHLATQTISVIQPKVGNYVICSLPKKNSMQWPEEEPILKNFVGHICRLNESEEIELKFLTKNTHSKYIFRYPENVKISHVSKVHVVKILQDPYQNRRSEWVFKDKSVLDYIF